jgi:hypothetical protein
MGNTIWLQATDGQSVLDDHRDNSFLLNLAEALDTVAARLNVATLSSFHDYSSLAEDLVDELDDLPEDAEMPAPVWFDAKEGHAAMAALLDELRAHPDALGFEPTQATRHWPAGLMDDLQHCESALRAAAALGHKFRLLIVS